MIYSSLRKKMEQGGCTPLQVQRFIKRVRQLLEGKEQGLIPESHIAPVGDIVSLSGVDVEPELLRQTVMLKLNGGLGTTMGLRQPKGMLRVRGSDDFYSILLKQIEIFGRQNGYRVPLIFMNSFASAKATRDRLTELGFAQSLPWEVMQSRVPKIDERGNPFEVEANYSWCPPGHGDLYAALLDSGMRESLLGAGYQYLFISNIDNLGAVIDSRPVAYMRRQGLSFLMEVTPRGVCDRKGGHIASDLEGRLLLRERSQCPDESLESFQDIERYRYFNTNNLWIDLRAIDESWTDLPLIVNRKPVIPHDVNSPVAIQLETALGAAIGRIDKAGAIAVGRDRFLPVKTTSDLLAIGSDLYDLDELGVLQATVERLPDIDLDPSYYEFIEAFNSLVLSTPSLRSCRSLKVRGPVIFSETDVLHGQVSLVNTSPKPVLFRELV